MPTISEIAFRRKCRSNNAFLCPSCGHRNVGQGMKCRACTFDAWKEPEKCQTFVRMKGTRPGLIPVMEFDDSIVAETKAPRKRRRKT